MVKAERCVHASARTSAGLGPLYLGSARVQFASFTAAEPRVLCQPQLSLSSNDDLQSSCGLRAGSAPEPTPATAWGAPSWERAEPLANQRRGLSTYRCFTAERADPLIMPTWPEDFCHGRGAQTHTAPVVCHPTFDPCVGNSWPCFKALVNTIQQF